MKRWEKTIGGVLLVLVLLSISNFVFPEMLGFLNRFTESVDLGDTTNGRIAMWGIALTMFSRHPIIGNGWYYYYYNAALWENAHVHNIYIQLLTETGVVGTLIFGVFMVMSYKRTIEILKISKKH